MNLAPAPELGVYRCTLDGTLVTVTLTIVDDDYHNDRVYFDQDGTYRVSDTEHFARMFERVA